MRPMPKRAHAVVRHAVRPGQKRRSARPLPTARRRPSFVVNTHVTSLWGPHYPRQGSQGVLRVQRQSWPMCTGKAGPCAPAANAVLCAGKKFARGFDRVRTYHQKFTAQVRRKISVGSARAEAAQGLNGQREEQGAALLRAFESSATRDSLKLGLMPFEIARPARRIWVPARECAAGDGRPTARE